MEAPDSHGDSFLQEAPSHKTSTESFYLSMLLSSHNFGFIFCTINDCVDHSGPLLRPFGLLPISSTAHRHCCHWKLPHLQNLSLRYQVPGWQALPLTSLFMDPCRAIFILTGTSIWHTLSVISCLLFPLNPLQLHGPPSQHPSARAPNHHSPLIIPHLQNPQFPYGDGYKLLGKTVLCCEELLWKQGVHTATIWAPRLHHPHWAEPQKD